MKQVGSDLLLYVDDIIIIGRASVEIQQVIQSLSVKFDLKDLGDLHYFLGIQITRTEEGLTCLSQSTSKPYCRKQK